MKTRIVLVFSLISVLFGCKEKSLRQNLLPGVSGKAGELVIIIDDQLWKGECGDFLHELYQQDMPALPQSEPLFNVVHIPHKAYSDIFKIHRNLLFIKVNDEFKAAKISVSENLNAQPQTVVEVTAPNEKVLFTLLASNGDKLLSIFEQAERKRLENNYTRYAEHAVMDKVKKKAGIDITIPKGYTYDLDTNNFIWVSHETPEISQGIFIYSYPYSDTSEFSHQALLNKHNEILKSYVNGPTPGSFMTTETQVETVYASYLHNNEYTAELRGLWKVEGDFMGGPFMSISKLDKKNGRIVTVEGYVYAPKFNKRNYIRQIEAILFSMKFPE